MKIVQLGANSGNDHVTELVKNNNIEFFLLVEPNKLVIPQLKQCYASYQTVMIEECAVVENEEQSEVELYYSEGNCNDNYQLASLSKNFVLSNCHETDDSVQRAIVPTITLNKLFDKYNVHELDYLFVDIEGADAEVILSLDLNKVNIKNIHFEYIHISHENTDKLQNFFSTHGYQETAALPGSHLDRCFTKN